MGTFMISRKGEILEKGTVDLEKRGYSPLNNYGHEHLNSGSIFAYLSNKNLFANNCKCHFHKENWPK